MGDETVQAIEDEKSYLRRAAELHSVKKLKAEHPDFDAEQLIQEVAELAAGLR